MKFGFMVPRESDFDDGGDPYPRIYEYCQRAEELGFDFATFTHHRFTPDRPYLSSPFVIMSAVAAQTQRLELMTTIFILPLYHPLDVAESAAALDLLSGGRLVLGVGAGYREYEARAVGVDYRSRVSRMVESIDVLQRAWSEEKISHDGTHFSFEDVEVLPRPARAGGPPIWIGAMADVAVERAGRIADGWIAPSLQTLDTVADKAGLYRETAAVAGRRATLCLERDAVIGTDRELAQQAWLDRNLAMLEHYQGQGAVMPEDGGTGGRSFDSVGAGRAVAGTPDDCIEQLQRAQEATDCEYVQLMNLGAGPGYAHRGNYASELDALELFGREVLPAFR